jgi:hypothetical protein
MNTYLVKYHQNSGAELLKPRVLEQSHAKHALKVSAQTFSHSGSHGTFINQFP